MRRLVLCVLVAAGCGRDVGENPVKRSYAFGPFDVAAGQEISNQCVQITLHNDTDIYVNTVELAVGGPGFHHSNWDFVPAGDPKTGTIGVFPGPDGVFTCADRNFDQAVGAQKGGTLFAQSTQSSGDTQQFPPGGALKIPKNSKLVSTIHLLNTSDSPITINPTISLTSIPESQVTTLMAAMAFENHALGLPPGSLTAPTPSSFTLDCDFQTPWTTLYQNGDVSSPTPNFQIYYALAHYHKLGTGMQIEAVRPDSSSKMMFQTSSMIGDSLGATLDPPFDMTGYSRLRFTCDYANPTQQTVGWGIGNQEMCVFLAFTDSAYLWAGGETVDEPPGPATVVNGVQTFHASCQVFGVESSTH